MKLLSIQNLSLSINGSLILNNINLNINQSDIFGIVGESGAGKSMTAGAITRLLPENSNIVGRIIFNGEDITRIHERHMSKIRGNEVSMIFQEPMKALNPLKTIEQQVAETLIIHTKTSFRKAREIALAKLERVGIDINSVSPKRYPHELSGGQRQRVMIAMAIALKPKLLIADEPTTALDVTTQEKILVLLKELVVKEKMALMIITHDLGIIAKLTNKVVVMKDGSVIDSGETTKVFTKLQHPYTKQLLLDYLPSKQKINKSVSEENLLNVKQVSKSYKKKYSFFQTEKTFSLALHNVSFRLKSGECIGLVGESGCGKSTLARSILGLESIQEGEIFLNNFEITKKSFIKKQIRAQMQVVFQDPYSSFNPRHKIKRIIAEPLFLLENAPKHQKKSDLLIKTIENVGLTADDLEKYPNEFSGGQRQRIAIARSIIIEPKLVILDEALSALDASIRKKIIELLQKLSKEYNLSYLFITHDLQLVKSITDKVLIMYKGKIIEQGKTEEVLKYPKTDYAKKLIGSSLSVPKEWEKISI